MKTARFVTVWVLVSAGAVSAGRADPTPARDSDPSTYESRYAQYMELQQKLQDAPTLKDLLEAKEARERRENAKDWLVRAFKQQQQLDEGTPDKDATKSDDASAALHPGSGDDGHAVLTLRPDPNVKTDTSSSNKPGAFKPLLAAEPPSNSYRFSPSASLSGSVLYPNGQPAPPTKAEKKDASAIETPGALAAQNDPLGDRSGSDLSFDMASESPLPDDNRNNPTNTPAPKLELPLATDLAQVQKQQSAALSIPGKVQSTPPPPTLNPLLLQTPRSPTSEMVRVPPPLRVQIADPNDVF
jgi:hypothetical protein